MKLKKVAVMTGVLAAVTLSAGPVEAATVQVTSLSSTGWAPFTRDTGVVEIASDYGAPPALGTSALVLDTPLGNDKANAFLAAGPGGTPLGDVAEISYWAYRSATSTASPLQAPALNIEVDVNGAAAGGFTTLVYEPVYNGYPVAFPTNAWTNIDAYAGGAGIWWSSNAIPSAPNRDTFVPWSTIVAANPDAVVLRIGINQGGGNPGLFGAADGFAFNGTTYNFETFVPTKDDCKNGGWSTKFPAGTFANQGRCVSYFARLD